MNTDAVLDGRLRSQRLHLGRSSVDVTTVVREVAAIQAQDLRAAALGVRVRSRGLRADDVSVARTADRSIVRAWCMRGTLHLVPAGDLRDLLAIFGPLYIHRGRRRLRQLGLDDDLCDRALPQIRDLLAGTGAATRHEIHAALTDLGLPIDRGGQAPIHLVRRACLEGIAVEVGARDGEPIYGLLDDWLPGDPCDDRSAALGTLARRYLAAHQPADAADFAAWSGLPTADVRTGWQVVAALLVPVGSRRRLWRLAEPSPVDDHNETCSVRLLPAFDGYLLGYRERTHAVDQVHWPAVHPGGGMIRPTVLVDGVAVATWRIDRSARRARVHVRPFATLPRGTVDGIHHEARDVGRFLGHDLDVDVEPG